MVLGGAVPCPVPDAALQLGDLEKAPEVEDVAQVPVGRMLVYTVCRV